MEKAKVISQIRAFNRFYVDLIGLLKSGGYHSKYTLAETRVLFEISTATAIKASEVMHRIEIDKSYLSRILKKFENNNLISRQRSKNDGRAVILTLTSHGKIEIESINNAASKLVEAQIENLDDATCQNLILHMEAIKKIYNSIN